MTLRHLKIFVAVCEHGSTTKASKALFIVQPTISHTITELEKYYQVPLFERVNQRLVLTEIGRELYKKAKEQIKEVYRVNVWETPTSRASYFEIEE